MKRRVVGAVRAAKSSGRSARELRKIQTSEAKVRLPQLLRDVQRGESLIITRHGRQIARIVPEMDGFQEEIDRTLAGVPGAGGGRNWFVLRKGVGVARKG
jgi:prevent-host-death family protein